MSEPATLGLVATFATGAVIIAMGIAMMTGQLTRLGYWLLEQFPVLGRIG